jgi:hypothetical protein
MEKIIEGNVRELGERAKAATSKLAAETKNLRERIGGFVKKNPGVSLLGALAAGFVTALIARRFS